MKGQVSTELCLNGMLMMHVDCPRYTQKYLFPSSVSANPVNHASTTIPSAFPIPVFP